MPKKKTILNKKKENYPKPIFPKSSLSSVEPSMSETNQETDGRHRFGGKMGYSWGVPSSKGYKKDCVFI